MGKKRKKSELTSLDEKIIEHYVKNGCQNQSAALLACNKSAKNWKPQTLWVRAAQLFARSKVKLRLAELQAELRAHAERELNVNGSDVLREYVRIGFSDIRNLFEENGFLKAIHQLDDNTAAAVSSVKVVSKHIGEGDIEYVHEIKLWPKNPALDSLAKNLGLFKEDNDQRKTSLTLILSDLDIGGLPANE